jgi:UDP-N-acetylmuramoyl-L-alanyl-D-glutamate--2,6-diaminopimelate ligase
VSATLAQLLREGIPGRVTGDPERRVHDVRHDSRLVAPGDLFVALDGATVDGARFVPEAIARGAAAVMVRRELLPGESTAGHDAAPAGRVPGEAIPAVPQLIVDDPRRWLSLAAAVVHGHPTVALNAVGVTGTNGKTTVAHLVEQALASCGHRTAMLGTVAQRGPGFMRPSAFTTPEGDDVARFAREVLDLGATHLVMEVSSHALAQHRVDAVRFRVAAFTNLTQDHLDFHGSMEAYAAAKARLFLELGPGASVVCVDGPFGERLAGRLGGRALVRVSVRAGAPAEVRATRVAQDARGLHIEASTPAGPVALRSPLVGAHNAENLLVALGCLLALDVPLADAARALGAAPGAPGRLERIPDGGGATILVDYAHTADALARVLEAVRPITRGRSIVVFGCGGDRDRAKRPLMGRAAAEGADLVVVTSDNPRTEDPAAIIAEIVPGVASVPGMSPLEPSTFGEATRGYVVKVDRGEAIALALGAARPGDTVLIAGKGHEDYQVVGAERRPFDDRRVAASCLRALGRAPTGGEG